MNSEHAPHLLSVAKELGLDVMGVRYIENMRMLHLVGFVCVGCVVCL